MSEKKPDTALAQNDEQEQGDDILERYRRLEGYSGVEHLRTIMVPPHGTVEDAAKSGGPVIKDGYWFPAVYEHDVPPGITYYYTYALTTEPSAPWSEFLHEAKYRLRGAWLILRGKADWYD